MSRPRVSGVASTERPPASIDEGRFASEAWLGRLVDGRYKIESLLGEGGMGAVFLAEHVKLAKKVALKVILPQFAGDGELAERFAREAMSSAKLDHPHVASALDYGVLEPGSLDAAFPGGGAYLVMPYVRGRSLRAAMESQVVSPSGGAGWRFACEIGAQIADALSAAHAHRIVHRDLKPENVILEPREDGSELVKVLDFGVARVVADESAAPANKALTRIGTIIGTPGYMAPEQALGESVDTRADLYALGVLLWEIVAHEQLFPEDDLTAIVTRQLTSAPARLTTFVPDIPPELDDIIARLLARAREDRPERAGEVRDVLQRLALGATLERKMLSGEIALPFRSGETPAPLRDPTGPQGVVQGVGAAPTMHAVRGDVTGPRRAAPPSVVMPASIGKAAEKLGGTIDIGPLRNLPMSLVVVGLATPIVLAIALAGIAFALGGRDAAPVIPTVAVTSPQLPVAPPQAAQPTRPPEPAAPTVPSVAMPAGTEAIPIELARDVGTLMDSSDDDEREAAAERLREAGVESAPAFVSALIDLELANRCPARRDAVRALGEIGDTRALPALERLDRARRGCGFLGSQDCNRCLRRDLRSALSSLRPE